MSHTPTFHELSRAECEALLTSQHVGRMAFAFRNRVDIEPVHFVYRDGWIYGRTQPGTKLSVLAHHPWVAFEVDEVDALFDWRSVVVHGRVEFPDAERGPREQQRLDHTRRALQSLLPLAFTDADPTPHRDVLFAIAVEDMTGREARS
ncbi:MAG: hypothetical protein RLZZ621_1559 [Gemmatimonadota bacterium]|jgi:nitroimidazol reductase NimA-like FMN-containing flavoprotein (pyridoxamine 5'-phosphate oxidase superfamily)